MIHFSELVDLFELSQWESTKLLSKKLLSHKEAAIQSITDPNNELHGNYWCRHKLNVSISTDNDFLICGENEFYKEWVAETKEEVINLAEAFLLNAINYSECKDETKNYFINDFAKTGFSKLRNGSSTFLSYGNWDLEFNHKIPLEKPPAIEELIPTVMVLGQRVRLLTEKEYIEIGKKALQGLNNATL